MDRVASTAQAMVARQYQSPRASLVPKKRHFLPNRVKAAGHKKLKRRVGRDPGGPEEVFLAAASLDTRECPDRGVRRRAGPARSTSDPE